MNQFYDIAVVGGGPAGYVAAIRAAKEGKQVVLIEADHLGGTCLNRGCIPSKTLLHQASVLEQIRQAGQWGIEAGAPAVNLSRMMAHKDQVINRLRAGIASLLKAGKIAHLNGWGEVHADKRISVRLLDGQQVQVQAAAIILATGSMPAVPPVPGLQEVSYYTSDTMFGMTELPASIAILGGGFIGVECACIFAGLGVPVTLIELADRLIPAEDAEAAAALTRSLRKKGVTVWTGRKVNELSQSGEGAAIQVRVEEQGGAVQSLNVEAVLVATGRKPNTSAFQSLDLAMTGPFVKVNAYMETSHPGIYAAGDVIGGWQLAHVASAEGEVAAINAAGGRKRMDYKGVPRCIYTDPEIASTGLSEQEAKEHGYEVRSVTFSHAANGKALAAGAHSGFTKLIADATHGEVLGLVMVGPHVTEMIAAGTAFLMLEATVEDVAGMIYPHPTVSETMLEAAVKWLETR